jgi:hypothetical protein
MRIDAPESGAYIQSKRLEALMKVRFVSAAILAALVLAGNALACGDKFLIVGRGARFQRNYIAVHPSSLLVLNASLMARRDIQAQLQHAGHRLTLVTSAEQLRQAVSAVAYDAVLADITDVPLIERTVAEAQNRPLLLPVVDGSSRQSLAAAEAQFKCLLKTEKRQNDRRFLVRLDAALDAKLKSKAVTCEVN